LGWDARVTTGASFDLDTSVFLLKSDNKVKSDVEGYCFFNNKKVDNGSVEHMGDNLTGVGEGDDEVIKVNLSSLSSDIEKIVFAVKSMMVLLRNRILVK
jgi:tellurium resistance protein TerD